MHFELSPSCCAAVSLLPVALLRPLFTCSLGSVTSPCTRTEKTIRPSSHALCISIALFSWLELFDTRAVAPILCYSDCPVGLPACALLKRTKKTPSSRFRTDRFRVCDRTTTPSTGVRRSGYWSVCFQPVELGLLACRCIPQYTGYQP